MRKGSGTLLREGLSPEEGGLLTKTLEHGEDHALCLTQVDNVTDHRDIVEPAKTTAVSPERALSVLPLPVNHPVSQRCHRQSANSLKPGSRGSLLHPWGLAEGLLACAFRQATQAPLHAAPIALRQKTNCDFEMNL